MFFIVGVFLRFFSFSECMVGFFVSLCFSQFLLGFVSEKLWVCFDDLLCTIEVYGVEFVFVVFGIMLCMLV